MYRDFPLVQWFVLWGTFLVWEFLSGGKFWSVDLIAVSMTLSKVLYVAAFPVSISLIQTHIPSPLIL